MKSATSLPWYQTNEAVYGPDGYNIFDADTWNGRTRAIGDAAYIVHACNNFPRLVTALKDCLVAFAEMKPKEEDYQNVNAAALLLKELGE